MRTLSILLASGGLYGQAKIAPVAADPHELVTGMAQVLSTPSDRANAMTLLERAKQNSDMHMSGAPPFALRVAFRVTGNRPQTGLGEITETWLSGRSWRYDQNLGSYSEIRVSGPGQTFTDRAGVTPMTVQMVRSALFWPVGGNPSVNMIRSAPAQWNGKRVTAILISGSTDSIYPGRHWVETEYVVDNETGLLQIYSRAPGTYAVYSYDQGLQFHGRRMPNGIAIFVAGLQVVEANLVSIQDPGAVDPAFFSPTGNMRPNGPASAGMNMRFPIQASDPTNSGTLKQVIVHATLDGEGNVVDSELSAAADPTLIEPALNLVNKSKFNVATSQTDAYINVRFGPN